MRAPDSRTVWQGSWHHIYYVSSRERYYSHLRHPAKIEYCESGYGSTKRHWVRHYYTYSQISDAVEVYNARPRTQGIDLLAVLGPDPGYAPFPGRNWIGAYNEREAHERLVRLSFEKTRETAFRAKAKRKDGTVCYYVDPSERAAKYLGVQGPKRKSFPKEDIEEILPKVRVEEASALEAHVAQKMAEFDKSWGDRTHPSLVRAAKELNKLETAEKREQMRMERSSVWYQIQHDDEAYDENVPHPVEGVPGWLTHVDHRDGCTYSRPDRDTSVYDPQDGHRLMRGDLAQYLRIEKEREVLSDVFDVLGKPAKLSNSGRAWWLGAPEVLASRVTAGNSVWEHISAGT